LQDVSCWIITDGKAGDEQQCIGVAASLGIIPEIKRVAPRAPWSFAMPWGPVDPAESCRAPHSALAPPFPMCVMASGRRSVPYLREIRKASGGGVFTVFLKDPRTGPDTADFIWAPLHDAVDGPNVFKTLTPPHRVSADRLSEARRAPDSRLDPARTPRVAVLVGGNGRHHHFTPGNIRAFADGLARLAAAGAYLMITLSRRTPPDLEAAVKDIARRFPVFLWDGTGENPYISLLALAEWVIVTTDSYNLVGEAAASGAPMLLFAPQGGHAKFDRDLAELKKMGVAFDFDGTLTGTPHAPLDSTPVIAGRLRAAWENHQAQRRLRREP
jgi:mitochondrial fission protein ELM1